MIYDEASGLTPRRMSKDGIFNDVQAQERVALAGKAAEQEGK